MRTSETTPIGLTDEKVPVNEKNTAKFIRVIIKTIAKIFLLYE